MPMKTYGSQFRLMELIRTNQLEPLLNSVNQLKVHSATGVPKNTSPAENSLEKYLKNSGVNMTPFEKWWAPHGGKTPTFDYLCQAEINGQSGYVLLEAKAHKYETSSLCKKAPTIGDPSFKKKMDNHLSIQQRIKEELDSLGGYYKPSQTGSYVGYYQVANRIAYANFTSRMLNKPVILIFLGFVGETDFKPDYFRTSTDWENHMRKILDLFSLSHLEITPTNPMRNHFGIVIMS